MELISKNIVRKIIAIGRKEKCGVNEKAFLGTVNTASFEVWDQLLWSFCYGDWRIGAHRHGRGNAEGTDGAPKWRGDR